MKYKARLTACAALFFLIISAASLMCGCGAAVYESVADGRGTQGYDGAESAGVVSGGSEQSGETEAAGDEEKSIFVYVCGAVRNSGVYELPAGARVFEAIEAAGGLTGDADEAAINQAEILTDGQQVTALYEGEAEAQGRSARGETGGPSGGTGGLININTAGRDELMRLSGIGEVRAADIIAYRDVNGPFGAIEDI
ncbi:MAG: ComEA family DNA-binding protein, partial [Lachnospiraceae bacterium]|nr:ComEA family DNA-binding protein [Lachnospiraceae bacterium]